MGNLPEWHEKPLELTVEEISNPTSVVSDFLHSYPLPEFRKYLKSLLLMACNDQDCNASFNIILCEDVVRLVEACDILLGGDQGNGDGVKSGYCLPKTITGSTCSDSKR